MSSNNEVLANLEGVSITCPTCKDAKASLKVSKTRYEEAIKELEDAKSLFLEAKASLVKENKSLEDGRLKLEGELKECKAESQRNIMKISELENGKKKVENELKESTRLELEKVTKESKPISDSSSEQLKKQGEYEKYIGTMGVKRGNYIVFFDMKVRGVPVERIVIELYADIAPRLADIFCRLCKGEMILPGTNRVIGYKGTDITHVFSGQFFNGGNLKVSNAIEFGSIYGDFSTAKMSSHENARPGDVLLNCYYHSTNLSFSFMINVAEPKTWLGTFPFPLIGRVIQGMDMLKDKSLSFSQLTWLPEGTFVIADCGQLF